jgi:hypothetical protein
MNLLRRSGWIVNSGAIAKGVSMRFTIDERERMRLFLPDHVSNRLPVTVGAIGLVALGLGTLNGGSGDDGDRVATRASVQLFVDQHYTKCLDAEPDAEPVTCAMRTIQLASALHGAAFADSVADQLR